MITKHGTISVTAEEVVVTNFAFEGVTQVEGGIEACRWAIECLHAHISDAEDAMREGYTLVSNKEYKK